LFVAAHRLPATLPAKSDVTAKTDRPLLSEDSSMRSRTIAATLRPVARASCLSRRSVISESLMVSLRIAVGLDCTGLAINRAPDRTAGLP
jgi:hypothetical protein